VNSNHAVNPVVPGADNQGPLEAAAEAQESANQTGNTEQYWQAPSNETQSNYDQNNIQNYQSNQNQNQNNGTGNNGYYGENFGDNNQNHNHGYQNQSHAHEDSEYTPAIKEDG